MHYAIYPTLIALHPDYNYNYTSLHLHFTTLHHIRCAALHYNYNCNCNYNSNYIQLHYSFSYNYNNYTTTSTTPTPHPGVHPVTTAVSFPIFETSEKLPCAVLLVVVFVVSLSFSHQMRLIARHVLPPSNANTHHASRSKP